MWIVIGIGCVDRVCCHLGNYEYPGEADSNEDATGEGVTQRGKAKAELKT